MFFTTYPYPYMKKELKLGKKVEKDFQDEKRLLDRFNKVIGQMEAAKTRKDILQLSHELHSIIRALEGIQKDLALDILKEVKSRLQDKNDRALVIQMNKAIAILEKKYIK